MPLTYDCVVCGRPAPAGSMYCTTCWPWTPEYPQGFKPDLSAAPCPHGAAGPDVATFHELAAMESVLLYPEDVAYLQECQRSLDAIFRATGILVPGPEAREYVEAVGFLVATGLLPPEAPPPDEHALMPEVYCHNGNCQFVGMERELLDDEHGGFPDCQLCESNSAILEFDDDWASIVLERRIVEQYRATHK